jgi:hypothetical protein
LQSSGSMGDNNRVWLCARERNGRKTMSASAGSSNILAHQILGAILALAKREQTAATGDSYFAFRGYDFQLQQIFSRLTKKHSILGAFVFSESGPDPYSPILNESVSKLQLAGLIGRENPDYEIILLRPVAEKFYNELEQRLSPEDLRQLKDVAHEFLSSIEVVQAIS